MDWLNYHHLLYFWTLAREGSLAKASAELRLSQSTISGQIHALEAALGERLFIRSGRRLVLTEIGRTAYRYADEIYGLGRELQDAIKGRESGRPLTLTVGITDALPKLVARRLLEPALQLPMKVRLVCHEDRIERLLADLALHALDLVLADAPSAPSLRLRAYDHLLGESNIALFATQKLARKVRPGFPRSLDGAPLLLPTEGTALRRSLDQWLAARDLKPNVVGEFEDSALLQVFGQAGIGIFPAHSFIADEVKRQYQVQRVGVVSGVHERFYAISVDKKLKHKAALAITQAVRSR